MHPPRLEVRLGSVLLACSPLAGDGPDAALIEFNRDIRPILAENCYACHGPDRGKRKAGLRLDQREVAIEKGVLVPGSAEESEIVRRILSTDPEESMPPPEARKHLTETQKRMLEAWVAAGAPYQMHWAYAPLARPAVPALAVADRAANPIDAFLLARLDAQGITPSPRADDRTLLRRLSLDLVGLPPTPEEIARFLADDRPEAFEREIDRLLASPHYGERMAVAWLDLARFADTVGYHGDQNVNVFPYRDWVIDAFDANMPFDRFTLEQVAGDLLPDKSERTLVATAFHRLNMVTREGGAQPKEYLAKYAADRVRTVAATWLGSTMGCAECHDHKYDPFTTRDFYRFSAFFADVTQWGVYHDYDYTPNPDLAGWSNDHPFPPEIEVESPYLVRRIGDLERRANDVLLRIRGLQIGDPEASSAFVRWHEESLAFVTEHPDGWMLPEPRFLAAENADPGKRVAAELQDDRSLLFTGGMGEPVTMRISLEEGCLASIRLELLPDETHGGTIVRDGGESTWVTLGARLVPLDGGEAVPLTFFHADADRKEPRFGNGFEVLGIRSGWATSSAHAREVQTGIWQLEEPRRVASGQHELEVTLAHGSVGRARVSISPLAARNLLERDPSVAVGEERARETFLLSTDWDVEGRAEYRKILREIRECRGGMARVVVTVAREPLLTRVLRRGNWQDESGEIVEPGVPAFLPQPTAEEGRRLDRLDLARWLVSPENPLVARTFVNRLWKQFFGTALSAMVDDLGTQGEWPLHGELLDWLAAEFVAAGWDVKHMVRLIVGSQAYRRAASGRADLAEIDPENRWLARQSARRLEAEIVRDNTLFAAGLLDLSIGGPSSHPYQPPAYYANLQFPDRDYKPEQDERQYRRGLYMHWQRTFLHPMLANFDAPSREECTASRVVSNTPQQALTLLNDPSFVEASRALAKRLLAAVERDDAGRIDLAFDLVLGRPPREAERAGLLEFLASERARYAAAPEEAARFSNLGASSLETHQGGVELAAWTALARVMLNLHETITRY